VKRNIFGSILFIIISASVFAQTESASDSLEFKPLGKGSFLVGMGGSISSNNIAQSTFTTNAAQFGNTYQFDVMLGRFVADKNLLGLQFNTKKVSLLGEIETTADVTNIGPMYRRVLNGAHTKACQGEVFHLLVWTRKSGLREFMVHWAWEFPILWPGE
jgi:hypothetical protein